MRNLLSLITVFTIIMLNGCAEKNNHTFSISGNVLNIKENYVVLSIIDDIQNNTSTIIDTLKINKKGEFNSVYFLEPAIYSLNFRSMYLLIKKCVKDFSKENVHKGNNQKEILLINQGQFETQLFFI